MNRYDLYENGYRYETIDAENALTALDAARGNVDRGNYGPDEGDTLYIDIKVINEDDPDDHAGDTVVLEPDDPLCDAGQDHDWQSPFEVLGGIRENPGVWGHGGGAIIKEVCQHCGGYRITDTWAQRRDTGEQGFTEIRYEEADDESRAWVEGFELAAEATL